MLKNQLEITHSADLKFAKAQIAEINEIGNHVTQVLTFADLIQLGGFAAVEYCGGPQMEFRMGRPDVESEGDAVHHDRENYGTSLIVEGLNHANLLPEEYVAMMGLHTLGFVGQAKKGFNTRWCMNPYVFDNTYFQELMLGERSKYYKTDADKKLMHDAKLKEWVEKYAQDQALFFSNYAKAHVKIAEMTFEKTLVSEIEPQFCIDGGYQEPRRPLMQGFHELVDRVKERYAIAKGEDEPHEEHDDDHDDEHHDDHDDHHDETPKAIENKH